MTSQLFFPPGARSPFKCGARILGFSSEKTTFLNILENLLKDTSQFCQFHTYLTEWILRVYCKCSQYTVYDTDTDRVYVCVLAVWPLSANAKLHFWFHYEINAMPCIMCFRYDFFPNPSYDKLLYNIPYIYSIPCYYDLYIVPYMKSSKNLNISNVSFFFFAFYKWLWFDHNFEFNIIY